ncbi:hypothetical protein FHX37_2633 [Haloactinospora alba]|uniref:Uncharacterized protein n=2 Tax=Haloactinospora alba TaxID=405555 RepID=A0A543NLG8_9ACTN|nr:hypothetical protein FHX37_2633 [Haloactinospora alba]
MFLRSGNQAQGLRAIATLAHYRSHTLHTDLVELATSTDAVADAATELLTDLLHLCEAAGVDAGELMADASDRFDEDLATHDGCQHCGNLLDGDEIRICGPCVNRSD